MHHAGFRPEHHEQIPAAHNSSISGKVLRESSLKNKKAAMRRLPYLHIGQLPVRVLSL